MALFEKKFCDICGEKIGMLGNRKLEDGNLCKDCAAKLSPWMSGRRHSTLDEIRNHLEYREQNKQAVAMFNATRTIGSGSKAVMIDQTANKFIVASPRNWRETNPDVIDIGQVTQCLVDIRDNKREIFNRTSDGKSVSYIPPRYEYSYQFNVTIQVNSPWFSEIEFELSSSTSRPDSPYDQRYRQYEYEANELRTALCSGGSVYTQPGGFMPQGGYNQPNGFMPQGGYTQPGGFMPQGGYNQPNGYNPQGGYNQPNGYNPQGGYNQPNGYNPQGGYNQPNGYNPQNGYNQPNPAAAAAGWTCPVCGMSGNTGRFCEGCGAPFKG